MNLCITIHEGDVPVEIEVEIDRGGEYLIENVTIHGDEYPFEKMYVKNKQGKIVSWQEYHHDAICEEIQSRMYDYSGYVGKQRTGVIA